MIGFHPLTPGVSRKGLDCVAFGRVVCHFCDMFKSTPTSFAHKLYESLCLKARDGVDKKASASDKIEKNLHTRLLSKIFLKEVSSREMNVKCTLHSDTPHTTGYR